MSAEVKPVGRRLPLVQCVLHTVAWFADLEAK